jgi:hypothetical protein
MQPPSIGSRSCPIRRPTTDKDSDACYWRGVTPQPDRANISSPHCQRDPLKGRWLLIVSPPSARVVQGGCLHRVGDQAGKSFEARVSFRSAEEKPSQSFSLPLQCSTAGVRLDKSMCWRALQSFPAHGRNKALWNQKPPCPITGDRGSRVLLLCLASGPGRPERSGIHPPA